MPSNRKFKIWLFLFLFICYSYVWHKPSWNDLGRYDLIMSIVEQGTVAIDAYHMNTGDKAIFNGHYYSDKAPGPTFLGVPIYWMLNQIQNSTGWGIGGEKWVGQIIWFYKLVIVRILIIALPSAFLGLLLFDFLSRFPITQRFALWLTLGYALGTMAFPYSTLFYGHQFAGFCIFGSFFILFGLGERKKYLNLWLGLAGFLAGYAILSEYPVALLSMVLIGYLVWKEKNWKSWVCFFAGMAIPILVLLYYNYLCSGNFFKVGYFHVAGLEFRREMEHGIAGVTYPKLPALWGITFSPYRGLFLINPFLIFSIPGFYFMYQDKNWRKEFWLCLSSVILFFLFNSSYYMWWGGYTFGPRHLVPIIPFLVIPMVFIPQDYWKWIYPWIILSILFVWVGNVVDPQMIPDTSLNPLFGYALNQLIQQKVSMNMGVLLGLTIPEGIYFLGLFILVGCAVLLVKVNKVEKARE